MAKVLYTCYLCGKKDIDTTAQIEGKDWMLYGPARKFHAHVQCFENFKKNNQNVDYTVEDEEYWKWTKHSLDFVWHVPDINWSRVRRDWNNFQKRFNYTPKGMFFALKFFYEIQHGDASKANGSIGIIPSIYQDSYRYWYNLETNKKGALNMIIEQMRSREMRPILKVQQTTTSKPKSKWALDDI